MQIKKRETLNTDILIIGGGTAGCYAALTIAEKSGYSVLIAEKANIKRSGCLAAGVNAINAYIVDGRKPEDYVDYAKKDADGIVREDLLLTMSEGLNRVTEKMEKLGLVILKDENGKYVARGNRNIKINGENIKPILADAVKALPDCTILNRVNITDFYVENNTICGAYGFSIDETEENGEKSGTAYLIKAKKVLCATGGAAGLYRPNNPGFSRHKMWYPPFNTGVGYAMGINAGAEMTTFEMRFIALRCKDTIAPTGTIAQGVGAKQVNSKGEIYETRPSGKTYTVGDEIPVNGESYSYPDDFDIVVLRDKVAVKVRDRMVVGIGSLDEYGYSDVPVINGRGFAVKIADEKDLKAFLSELNAQNGNISSEFFNKWITFETYRKIVFKDEIWN